jgi:hypothetical protein
MTMISTETKTCLRCGTDVPLPAARFILLAGWCCLPCLPAVIRGESR